MKELHDKAYFFAEKFRNSRQTAQAHNLALPGLPCAVSGRGLANRRNFLQSSSQAHLSRTWGSQCLHRFRRALLLAGPRKSGERVLRWAGLPRLRSYSRRHTRAQCRSRRSTWGAGKTFHLPRAHRNRQLLQSRLPNVLRRFTAGRRPHCGRRSASGFATTHPRRGGSQGGH